MPEQSRLEKLERLVHDVRVAFIDLNGLLDQSIYEDESSMLHNAIFALEEFTEILAVNQEV